MIETTLKLCGTTLVAGMLLAAPVAMAGPSAASPEMQKALAKAEEGPDELRRFVNRTRMIYSLNYFEVMSIHVARKAGEATQTATATQTVPVVEKPER